MRDRDVLFSVEDMRPSSEALVIEIRSYKLHENAGARLHALMHESVAPLLRDAGILVYGCGFSHHDDRAYALVRGFSDIEERQAQEGAFYGSALWRQGPRADVLDCIESYHDTVITGSSDLARTIGEGLRTNLELE